MIRKLKFKGKLFGLKLAPMDDSIISVLENQGIIFKSPWEINRQFEESYSFSFPQSRNSVLFMYTESLVEELVLEVREFVLLKSRQEYAPILKDILFQMEAYLDDDAKIKFLKTKYQELYYEDWVDYFILNETIFKQNSEVLSSLMYDLSEDNVLIKSYLCYQSNPLLIFQLDNVDYTFLDDFSWVNNHKNILIDQLVDNAKINIILTKLIDKINELGSFHGKLPKKIKRPETLKELFLNKIEYDVIIKKLVDNEIIDNNFTIIRQQFKGFSSLRVIAMIGWLLKKKKYLKKNG